MNTPALDALLAELSMLKQVAASAPPPMDPPHKTFFLIDSLVAQFKSSGMNNTMPMAQQLNSIFTMLASGRPSDMGPQPLI